MPHRFNYHTHTTFCDGKAEAEAFVRKALGLGFEALGFSSHAPLPFPTDWTMAPERLPDYIAEIRHLKNLYEGRIEIALGLEIDFIPGISGPDAPLLSEAPLDYRIGAVHYVLHPDGQTLGVVDGDAASYKTSSEQFGEGEPRAFVEAYYDALRRMMWERRFDFVAHLDVVKKNNAENRYFDEKEGWYRDAVMRTLHTAVETAQRLEVNTGGIGRGKIKEIYPSPWILAEARRLGLPLVLNSDAHHPDQLDAAFEYALGKMREAGYRELMILKGGRWEERGI